MSNEFKQTSGRAWAYVGTILGVTVSALANGIETATNPAVPSNWERAIVIGMGLLPVGLFVALEVLVRNRIKDHVNWWRLAMFITAVAFAVPSYSHMHDLLQRAGQNDLICVITPLGWDGMMLLSTLALLLPPGGRAVARPIAALTAHGEPWLAARDDIRALAAAVMAVAERQTALEARVEPAPDLAPLSDGVRALYHRLEALDGRLEAIASRPVTVTARTAPRPRAVEGKTRLKPTEYPFWDDFATAQAGPSPWDDEAMHKHLVGMKPDATAEAARNLRKRWVKFYDALTTGQV